MSASRTTLAALAAGLVVMWSFGADAQIPRVTQQPATARPMSGEAPTGAATRTTDKQGQTNNPRETKKMKEPPSAKLNLDQLPIERRGDGGKPQHPAAPSDAAGSGATNVNASHRTHATAKTAARSGAKGAKSSARSTKSTAKSVSTSRKRTVKHHTTPPR